MWSGKNKTVLLAIIFVSILSFAIFVNSYAFATNVTDDVSIELPVSCSINGVGMDSHNTTLRNGNYEPDIGTTTMHVYCNDNAGFSIYASGFSGDEYGSINSNKLIGTSYSDYASVSTGLNTGPVGGDDTSSWAMKLSTNAEATYPLTIMSDDEGSFASYHTVPNRFAKVATRLSGTDVDASAVGSTLSSTYGVYMSGSQPADIYTGKVSYVLIHPNSAPQPEPPVECVNNQPCIKIATLPNKMDYNESEPIDLTGIDIAFYNADGTLLKHLSVDDVSFSPSIASNQPSITSRYGVRVDSADDYLGRVIDRYFYKASNGAAIGYFRDGTSPFDYWMGPILIALSPESAQTKVVSGQSIYYSPTESFIYHGMTLYACHWYAYQTTNGSSPLPVFVSSPTSTTWADVAEDMNIVVSSNVVTITYNDPESGKILQDSFTININEQ